MVNKVTAAFLAADALFVVTGGIILGFCVIVQNTCFDTPTEGRDAARDLLYRHFPLTVGIVNSALILATFLVTLPALATSSRTWLKAAVVGFVVCGLFTLGIGVDLWIVTLRMRKEFENIWFSQPAEVQSLMQTAFQCCGYFNSTSPAFVTDSVCMSPATAALIRGCVTPLVPFGGQFVDFIFTGVFGMVGVDAVVIMAALCLLKDRKERERFRHIDEKAGFRRF